MTKEKKSDSTDGIKKSISETTRAISGNENLKIKFSADPSGDYGEVIKLPQISKEPSESEILKVRGTADSLALQARFKDEETFLKYDYIGAPWTKIIKPKKDLEIDLKKNRVGNGGFSLRSKKLTLATKNIDLLKLNFPLLTEDVIMCHYLYDDLVNQNINFAPIELAAKFSLEHVETNKEFGINNENVFGFHGKHLRRYFKERFIKKNEKN